MLPPPRARLLKPRPGERARKDWNPESSRLGRSCSVSAAAASSTRQHRGLPPQDEDSLRAAWGGSHPPPAPVRLRWLHRAPGAERLHRSICSPGPGPWVGRSSPGPRGFRMRGNMVELRAKHTATVSPRLPLPQPRAQNLWESSPRAPGQ